MNKSSQKLCVGCFGLAFGLLWSFAVFVVGIAAWQYQIATSFVNFFSGLYLGYAASLTGALIGAVWGFVDAFIFAALLAGLYNCCICCSARMGSCCPAMKKHHDDTA